MTDNGKPDKGRTPRKVLADFASNNEAEITAAIGAALQATKNVDASVQCRFCKRVGRYNVAVPDARSVSGLLTTLLDQGFGRPGTEPSEVDRGTTVSYRVELHCPGCTCSDTLSTETVGNG